ncbi:Zinc metalloproteinase [Trichostrongylus colubriformis]|uniref:Zinc metalloproteinase n=1 Tax=Trichostrongylus colubriformis TaxID=6319 RepID=A0AAN8FT89_TRICO
MRVLTLILLSVVCVSYGSNLNERSKSLSGKVEDSIKEGGNVIQTIFRKIKHAFNNKMAAFKKTLSTFKDKILKKLHLPKEEKQKLFERLKLFKRKKVDKVRPTGDSIEEINKRANITEEMFQGDIALSEEQQKRVVDDINGTDSRTKRQAYVYPNARTQWFKGVKYFFDESADEKVRTVFKKAADQWMAETCINFKPVSSKMNGIKMKLSSITKAKDRLRVLKGKGCWSYVGRLRGIQNLSLGMGCDSIDIAAHEIGHTLGFFHTHARHDRDQFITVIEENIEPDWLVDFAQQSPELNNNYNITYDYGSVMHYGATHSSIGNNMPTMVPKDVRYTETLGSPFIGFYDMLMINTHYNCFEKCKGKDTPKCQNYGFVNPRNCSKCVCPSGYGGDYCDRRPPGCGAELNATADWKPLVDEIGNRTAGDIPREDFMKCNYWVEAPIGKKIEVKIVSFTDGVAVDGCIYAGVEIKTHSNQGLPGYRFCSWNFSTVLESELNMVPVITYNRKFVSVTRLEYRYV